MATYKLSQLKNHLTTSHRLLNDLRTIRRLLFAERQVGAADGGEEKPAAFVTTVTSPVSGRGQAIQVEQGVAQFPDSLSPPAGLPSAETNA